jgi:hypothetical protein
MATAKILYHDFANATYSASQGSVSGSGLLNLKTGWNTDYWVSHTTSSFQWLAVDYGATEGANARNYALIDGHNFDTVMSGSGGTILLQAATNADFTAGLETVIAIVQQWDASSVAPLGLYMPFGSSVSKRYWRILYSGSLTEEPRIATWYIDNALSFQFPEKWGHKKENQRFNVTEVTSIDGTILTTQVYNGRLVYELTFPSQNETFNDAFQEFHSVVRGKLSPFYFYDSGQVNLRYMKLITDYTPMTVKKAGLYDINKLEMISVETFTDWYGSGSIADVDGLSGEYNFME